MPPKKKKTITPSQSSKKSFFAPLLGKLNVDKKEVFAFKHNEWNIAMFLGCILVALIIQAALEEHFDPRIAEANVLHTNSNAFETFKITPEYTILNLDTQVGHYISPGERDIDIFTFALTSEEAPIVFKEIKITKTGEIPDDQIIKAKLYEGEYVVSEARMKNGQFYFRGFSSTIQPYATKKYTVKLDLNNNSLPGIRFRYILFSPYDLVVLKDNMRIYNLARYPIEGAYVTVVGNRL